MTDVNNYKIECPYCKEEFITKTYSKHLLNKHKSEIFVNKHNREVLSEVANKKEGWWPSPLEFKMKDKTQYFAPCCDKFYTKDTQARKHNKSKECREKVIEKAKELLASVAPITIANTHSGSGNIINNITQHITVIDLSGCIQSIVKTFTQEIENERYDKVSLYKKYSKYKKVLEENGIDCNSETSSISSYFSDNECETTQESFRKLERVKPDELFSQTNRVLNNRIIKSGIDISREGVGLSTQEEHNDRINDKKKQEIEMIEDEIIAFKDEVAGYKEDIKDYKERLEYADEPRAKRMFENNIKNAEQSIAKLKEMIECNQEKIVKIKK